MRQRRRCQTIQRRLHRHLACSRERCPQKSPGDRCVEIFVGIKECGYGGGCIRLFKPLISPQKRVTYNICSETDTHRQNRHCDSALADVVHNPLKPSKHLYPVVNLDHVSFGSSLTSKCEPSRSFRLKKKGRNSRAALWFADAPSQ